MYKSTWYCRWCGNEYRPDKESERDGFCSDKCKQALHRAYKAYTDYLLGKRGKRGKYKKQALPKIQLSAEQKTGTRRTRNAKKHKPSKPVRVKFSTGKGAVKKLLSLIFVLGAILFLCGCASIIPHPRPWTKREKIAATFFIAAHTADALTTERHQDSPNRYHEKNPIMGRHPSDRDIGVYFSVTGFGALLIAHLYPELREPLLFGYGGVNAYMAIKNINMMRKD